MGYDLTVDTSGRVEQPENKTREYKRDMSSPEPVMRAVVAFANSSGGQVVIGIEDDDTVVGVADPFLEQERLANLVASWVSPQLIPTVELVPLGEATVVVADVALSNRRPHFLTKDGRSKGTYVRLAASNRQAGPDLIAELDRNAKGIPFDRLPAVGSSLDDLDTEVVEQLVGRDIGEHDLRTLELVTDDQGQVVPTNGGILVASEHPERFLPFAWVQCARFRGPTKRDIFDQEDFYGPLPLAIDKVMTWLKKNAFKHSVFGEIYRRDVWSIPVEPLREIITNALVHANYSTHGTPIKVAFRDETIEIESPGGLMPSLTVEEMIQGVSIIRNQVVARFFKELGLVERWGTGIPEALRLLAEAGLPPLDILELPSSLRFVVHIENHSVSRPIKERPAKDDDERVSAAKHQVGDPKHQVEHQVGIHARAILAHLAAGPSSRADIFAAIDIHSDYRAYVRHLVPLIDQGLVAMTNPDNPTAWTQRYVLTKTGHQALASLERNR